MVTCISPNWAAALQKGLLLLMSNRCFLSLKNTCAPHPLDFHWKVFSIMPWRLSLKQKLQLWEGEQLEASIVASLLYTIEGGVTLAFFPWPFCFASHLDTGDMATQEYNMPICPCGWYCNEYKAGGHNKVPFDQV